jgi:hypothetical protein
MFIELVSVKILLLCKSVGKKTDEIMKQTALHISQNVTEILKSRKYNKLDVLRKRAHLVCLVTYDGM